MELSNNVREMQTLIGAENSVNVDYAAELLNVHKSSIKRMIGSKQLPASTVSSSVGRAGVSYRIPVSALPYAAQVRYFEDLGQREFDLPDGESFDLHAYEVANGADAVQQLLVRQQAVLRVIGLKAAGVTSLTDEINRVAADCGMSGATLRRLTDRYCAEGLSGLVRKGRSDKGEARTMCLEARCMVYEMDLDYRRMPANVILDAIRERARELGPLGCENCPFNHESDNFAALEESGEDRWYPQCDQIGGGVLAPLNRHAVNRVIAGITAEERCYMQKGRKPWEAAYMTKVPRRKPDVVNDVWFGDHHQFDVFVIGEQGRPVRPWLTIQRTA